MNICIGLAIFAPSFKHICHEKRSFLLFSYVCCFLPYRNCRHKTFSYIMISGRSLYDKDLKGRPLLTSTVEKFHPDNWGSTYFFIDMDYTSEGVASAYWEIARELEILERSFLRPSRIQWRTGKRILLQQRLSGGSHLYL